MCIRDSNAGLGGPFHRVDEVDKAEWDALFGVNVEGVRFMCRWALPRMKASGYGRIVNIASLLGLFGGARSSTYAATKHALIGFSKSIAAEWASSGITCNAVCPGYVDTPMTGATVAAMAVRLGRSEDEARALLEKRQPIRRLIQPDEVAAAVLACVENGAINGQGINVDGGAVQS